MAQSTCSIPGCIRLAVGRGWCPVHWQRWKQHGDPLGGGAAHIGRAIDHEDGTRTCTKCHERKPLEQFDKVKSATLGRRSNCKACRSVQMRLRYEANREAHAAGVRARRAASNAAYRERDRERYRRDYAERREQADIRTAKRRSRIVGGRVDPGVTRSNLRKQYGDKCFYCLAPMQFQRIAKGNPWPLDLATIEHVVAVSAGGTHTWDNVVLACWSCNCSKRDTPLTEWLESRGALT